MPVVKAQQLEQRVRQSAIVMDLADMEHEGTRIITEARKQAEAIVAKAREEAIRDGERLREEARAAGHAEGLAKGMEEGRQAGHDEAVVQVKQGLEALIGRWDGALEAFEQGLPTHLADVKMDLVQLAVAIAAKVAKTEGLRNKGVIQANVDAALGLVSAGRKVGIAVHPDELAVVEGYLPELATKFRQVSGIEVIADDTLTPGGCVLRYGSGCIDGRLETQIDRIAAELLVREVTGT